MSSTLPGAVSSVDSIRLALRSWPEVDDYLNHCKGVILPLGSTEQHGPTGAIGTDALTAEAVALEVGRRTGVLVTPTQAFGMAEHHLGFAGTMSLKPATLLALIHDLVISLANHGFERVFVINGHGGNNAPSLGVWDQFQRRHRVNLHYLPYWDVYTDQDAAELLEGGTEIPGDLPGHAQEFETSFALAVFPENVRTDMWQDQEDQKPSLATAEKGAEFLRRAVERLTVYVQEMIDGKRVIETPPYFP